MGVPTIGSASCRREPRSPMPSSGAGPPLVLLPGWLSHVEMVWMHPAAASARDKLASAHRLIWYDRLGCGLSDRSGFTPSVENDVEQLEAVLDATGVERASLIGYSWGGPAAAVFAARHPERVERLVLYSTYARGWAVSSEETHEGFKALLKANWHLGSITSGSRRRPQRQPAGPQLVQPLPTRCRDAGDGHRPCSTRCAITTCAWRSRTIRTPTLVLTNQHDPVVDPEHSREVAALVPGATLHVLDGNEHEPFIRDSGNVVEAILDFVAGRPLDDPRRPPSTESMQPLSRREREVLQLFAEGEPNKAIAPSTSASPSPTVERHVASIYRKVGGARQSRCSARRRGVGPRRRSATLRASRRYSAGDIPSGIAASYGVSLSELVEANGWTDGANHAIFPGDVIALPDDAVAVSTTRPAVNDDDRNTSTTAGSSGTSTSCLNDIEFETVTGTASMSVGSGTASVLHLDGVDIKTYRISTDELARLLAGQSPADDAPDGYQFGMYPFVVTVQNGAVTAADQIFIS